MGYDFLIFDFDGTLVDSEKDIAAAVNMVRKEYGDKTLSVEKIRSFLGGGVNKLIDKAIPNHHDDYKKVLERFDYYYSKCLLDTTVVYDDVIEILEALKDKKKAVLSNKTEKYLVEIVKKLDLSKYFIKVWGGDTAETKKPDPKPILDLIKIIGAKKEKTVMIGDSENDFKAARAAGIDSIAVSYGYLDKTGIEKLKPTYIVDSPKEIIKIVNK